MTDRELLELAAKAAGYRIRVSDGGSFSIDNGSYWVSWNPLCCDGDALRLLATLNINISFRENLNGAWVMAEREGYLFCPESLDGPHEHDATRRAIVRAAAEIGKAME